MFCSFMKWSHSVSSRPLRVPVKVMRPKDSARSLVRRGRRENASHERGGQHVHILPVDSQQYILPRDTAGLFRVARKYRRSVSS